MHDFSTLCYQVVKDRSLLGPKLWSIYKNVLATDYLTGHMAELGVYKGGSAALIAALSPNRKLYLFDTFQGMPEDDSMSQGLHKKNDFSDTSIESVKYFLKGYNQIVFKQGYFPSTTINLGREVFSFVHLDADIYQSTKAGIEFFYPRLQVGGRIVFDDYKYATCPGVEKAITEYFKDKIGFTLVQDFQYTATLIKEK